MVTSVTTFLLLLHSFSPTPFICHSLSVFNPECIGIAAMLGLTNRIPCGLVGFKNVNQNVGLKATQDGCSHSDLSGSRLLLMCWYEHCLSSRMIGRTYALNQRSVSVCVLHMNEQKEKHGQRRWQRETETEKQKSRKGEILQRNTLKDNSTKIGTIRDVFTRKTQEKKTY